jgi:hypothetical protein
MTYSVSRLTDAQMGQVDELKRRRATEMEQGKLGAAAGSGDRWG